MASLQSPVVNEGFWFCAYLLIKEEGVELSVKSETLDQSTKVDLAQAITSRASVANFE